MILQEDTLIPNTEIPNVVCVDTETTEEGRIEVFSFSFVKDKKIKGYVVPVCYPFEKGSKYKNVRIALDYLKQIVRPESGRKIIMHNAQFDLEVFKRNLRIAEIPDSQFEDTMIMHWVLNTERRHGLKEIFKEEYGDKETIKYKEARANSFKVFAKYATGDVLKSYKLYLDLMKEFDKYPKTYELYRKYEIPFIRVMRAINVWDNKVRINYPLLKQYAEQIQTEMKFCSDVLLKTFGDINYNSTLQLGKVLEKLGYKVKRNEPTAKMKEKAKAKGEKAIGNYSLDASEIQYLYDTQGGEALAYLLWHRGLVKQDSTYITGLLNRLTQADKKTWYLTGYDFTHHGTRTGRLSGHNPNLQNQPRSAMLMRITIAKILKRNGLWKKNFIEDADIKKLMEIPKVAKLIEKYSLDIRKLFIPFEGNVFIGNDYSQIELRMVAHLSKDKNMIKAFADGKDLHQATADLLTKAAKFEVTRQVAKSINFGIVYGLYYTTLAREFGLKKSVAKHIYDNYFKVYSGVKSKIDLIHISAKKSHYVQTILGRRRNMHILGINDHRKESFFRRNNAENSSISTVVSGSASDLIKIAMLNIYKNLGSVIKLQVHDELVCEVPKEKAEYYQKEIIKYMEGAMKLLVPVKVDSKIGMSWREVH